ncbi:hypothetical protein [Halobacterium wangiae]|uniref:hypothetical protein n=1 Tax=Halobacterium wangiae TaxID=2902623 RepID=UPI001E44B9C2|nr:hypothetical protein [Halobacterium wangiae]
MNVRQRVLLLGLLVGSAHTVVRVFVFQSASTAIGASLTDLLFGTLATTLVTLAVLLGLPLYGALRLDVPTAAPRPSLAAVVAVGTGLAIFVTYPVASAQAAGAPLDEVLQTQFAGVYLVNAVSPAAYSGVSALAGFLLVEQNT